MHWNQWTIVICAGIVALWFVVDGTVALAAGDYVTPKSGQYAGQLGPWAKVVSAVGIEPRSNTMKYIFVIYGSLWLVAIVSFILGREWAWWLMLIAAVGSLWYLPFGTLSGLVQVVLLLLSRFGKMS